MFSIFGGRKPLLSPLIGKPGRAVPMPKPLLLHFGTCTMSELFEPEESIALRAYLLSDGRDEFFIGRDSLLLGDGALIIVITLPKVFYFYKLKL
jgi:hypothetical protein